MPERLGRNLNFEDILVEPFATHAKEAE